MPRKRRGPPPSHAQKFRGGPWSGRLEYGTSGGTSMTIDVDSPEAPAGHYVCAERLADIPSENAIVWAYDWVADEDDEEEEPAEDEAG